MLKGYIPKTKPALWRQAFSSQVSVVSKVRAKEARLYANEARAFVAASIARGESCPVVRCIDSLRNGVKYGHPISPKLSEIHHRNGRVGKLLRCQKYWMAVSKQGHRWIHANIREAREHGWICKEGDWNNQELAT